MKKEKEYDGITKELAQQNRKTNWQLVIENNLVF